MRCPECDGDTYVIRTIDKKYYTFRRRCCKKCNFRFNTKELTTDGWDHRRMIHKIKELLKDVKV